MTWNFCPARNLQLQASYTESKKKKSSKIKEQWPSKNCIFAAVIKRFGKPTINLFAPRGNF